MATKKKPAQLTLNRLLRTEFSEIYLPLVLGIKPGRNESIRLLSLAVILANQEDLTLKRLAYRIVVLYGNCTGDYIPLYDLSLNSGLIPVAELAKNAIESRELVISHSDFINEMSGSFINTFVSGSITLTEQQLVLNEYFEEKINNSLYVVAPTSYGKSELIINTIKESTDKRICILVPSKSLLAQTKKRILDARIDGVEKIVTHPEMHEENMMGAIYVLTQERLSRLLNSDDNLAFDYVFIDEAHNLLEKDYRSELLAAVISALCHRNTNTALKFLTPFVRDVDNLKLRTAPEPELSYFIDEYVKTEKFYVADFRESQPLTSIYDHYTNTFVPFVTQSRNAIDYIPDNSASKNIIYLNKPKDIEKLAAELAQSQETIYCSKLEVAVQELASSLDEEYRLIECLRKGVVYHHGSMTDSVRNYVEFLFRSSESLRFLVCNSTLLEGVNLPVERLFILDPNKGLGHLTPSQFKNLVGRVNRFSEIFSGNFSDGLHKLEPEIHLVANPDYLSSRSNIQNFIVKTVKVNKQIKDKPQNVLLENTSITRKNKKQYERAIARLENLERGVIDDYDFGYVDTDVGHLLIANSVSEINVFSSEHEINEYLKTIEEQSIDNTNSLLKVVYEAFVRFIDESFSKSQLDRLVNVQAQTFYAMMLDWKIDNTPFKLMIRLFMNYWDGLYERNPQAQVYVGKWGNETKGDGYFEHYTTMSRRTRPEKINLAIVRIKEEEDFIEFILFRFVEILNDLNKIDLDFFKRIKYGTTNPNTIKLIKNGFSRSVADLLLNRYSGYVNIDDLSNIVRVSPQVLSEMKEAGESVLQQFEVEMNIGSN